MKIHYNLWRNCWSSTSTCLSIWLCNLSAISGMLFETARLHYTHLTSHQQQTSYQHLLFKTPDFSHHHFCFLPLLQIFQFCEFGFYLYADYWNILEELVFGTTCLVDGVFIVFITTIVLLHLSFYVMYVYNCTWL